MRVYLCVEIAIEYDRNEAHIRACATKLITLRDQLNCELRLEGYRSPFYISMTDTVDDICNTINESIV